MPENAHPTDDQLSGFASGQLEDADSAVVEAHLKQCPQCVQRFDTLPPLDDPFVKVLKREWNAEKQPYAGGRTDGKASATGGHDADTTPKAFAGYRIIEKIAEGGMGVVYKAYQPGLERIVALKAIRSGEFANLEESERFQGEARVAAKLKHSGILPIYDIGERDGRHYFTMDYVAGGTLQDRLRDGPIRPDEAARLISKVAMAIQHAHESGIIHRDLKPANILLDDGGQPKVADFGLAKRLEDDAGLTISGMAIGTASYMPPEQAVGSSELSLASDLYSLGAVLYCLLTGRPPFAAASQMETLKQVLEQEPVAPRTLNKSVPVDLETICLKCLNKDPDVRYQTAEALADDLDRYLNGEPIHARPVGKIERSWQWCKRKPAAAIALGLTVLIGVLAPVVAGHQAFLRRRLKKANLDLIASNQAERRATQLAQSKRSEAEAAGRRETRAKQAAERQRQLAVEVRDFLVGLFRRTDPVGIDFAGVRYGGSGDITSDGRPQELTAEELLERGQQLLLAKHPQPSDFRAEILLALGTSQRSLGAPLAAESLLLECLQFRSSQSPANHRAWADVELELGRLYHDLGQLTKSVKHLKMADEKYSLAILSHRTPSSHDLKLLQSETWFHLAWVYSERRQVKGDMERADECFKRCVELRETLLGNSHRQTRFARTGLLVHKLAHDSNPLSVISLLPRKGFVGKAFAQFLMARHLRNTGKLEEAEEKYAALLKDATEQLGENHPLIVWLLGDFAGLLREMKKLEDAFRTIDRAIVIGKRVVGIHPKLLEVMLEAATEAERRGRLPDALKRYQECLAMSKRLGKRSKPPAKEITARLTKLESRIGKAN